MIVRPLHRSLLFFICLFSLLPSISQNPWNGKVVLQGFYWDYKNDDYLHRWSDYLTELAPRLREMGIDAIWIPPTYKNAFQNSTGYAPFDHYDLGDKYQKGFVNTSMGDKDQLLRMIAVMHANGIEVIQDITLNHMTDAGNSNGSGGQDPFALANYDDGSTGGYKNFRYVCYATPHNGDDANDYLLRKGRWSKNWPNFFPNASNPCCTDPINSPYWGPDVDYSDAGFGQSSCTFCFNPPQSPSYMRTQARDWLIWYKKQTGVDGFRFDAIKHFPAEVVEDLLWNAQYNAGFASGGWEMFSVGEYIGGGAALDNWANSVQNRAGTFDFGLRGEIKNMISGGGFYNLGQIPNSQQSNRLRTVPFVNLHDTFRPQVDENGQYASWDTFNELGGHIDPNDPRMAVAYAISFAVDGSPMVFFEDLFKLDTPERFDNDPKSEEELPVRDALANLIWCHQKLDFKAGAYKVRHTGADHLIIERSSKAIIGVNDNWNTWQHQWIPTDFQPGTELHDYSGANSNPIWVNQDGWVEISTPPCDGSNVRRGYTVWGPAGVQDGFNPSPIRTVHEWQMYDDLGDSHPWSLQQGGSIPANSLDTRTAGKVFCEGGTRLRARSIFETQGVDMTMIIADATGEVHLDSVSGTNVINYGRRIPSTGWYTLKLRNSDVENPSNRGLVQVLYRAPEEVYTDLHTKKAPALSRQGVDNSVQVYPNPSRDHIFIESELLTEGDVLLIVRNARGQEHLRKQVRGQEQSIQLAIDQLPPGVFQVEIIGAKVRSQTRFIKN